MISEFKIHNIVLVTKTAWYWHKNRYTDQCNRVDDPENTSTQLQPSDFQQWCQKYMLEQRQPLQKMMAGTLEPLHKLCFLFGYF
jgi:hypothetical protein